MLGSLCDVTVGLKSYFAVAMREAKGLSGDQNRILAARYLLEQYILLGMEQGPRPYATNTFMMKVTGLSPDRLKKAKSWLQQEGMITVEQDKRDNGTFGKPYVQINVITSPSLRGAISSLSSGWDGDEDERYGAESWETLNQREVQQAIDDQLSATAKASEKNQKASVAGNVNSPYSEIQGNLKSPLWTAVG